LSDVGEGPTASGRIRGLEGRGSRRSGRTALVGRAAWSTIDQAISSATNAGVVIVVAATLSAEEFGWFAIAFTVAAPLLPLVRQVVCIPFLLDASALGEKMFMCVARTAVGASVGIGLVLGAVVVTAGMVICGSLGFSLIAVGVALPGVLMQDSVRHVAFGQGRPRQRYRMGCGSQP